MLAIIRAHQSIFCSNDKICHRDLLMSRISLLPSTKEKLKIDASKQRDRRKTCSGKAFKFNISANRDMAYELRNKIVDM